MKLFKLQNQELIVINANFGPNLLGLPCILQEGSFKMAKN